MTIEIRKAGPEDVPEVLRMIKALALYEREPDAVQATEESLHEAMFGPEAVAHALIARRDGVIGGFLLYFYNFSTWTGRPGLYVEDLFVAEPERGRGLGRALLAQAARLALERGCMRVEWWVLDWNEPALRFYRSIGARAMSEWTVQRLEGEALHALAAGA